MDGDKTKTSFIMYGSWGKMITKTMTPDQCQRFMKGIFEYSESLMPPDFNDDPLLDGFFDVVKGALDSNKLKWDTISKARSKAGKKGAESRWNKEHDEPEKIAKMANDSKAISSNNTECLNVNVNDNDIANESVNDNTPNMVEAILEAYPRKGNEECARRQIVERIKEGIEPEKLLNAAKAYDKECRINDTPEKYIKVAHNFFGDKDRTYLDYIDRNIDDIKPQKNIKTAKTTFQAAKGRDYDYKMLERQLLNAAFTPPTDIKTSAGPD